ncbi:conserved exported protein of unknown function [Tenacibaculum sp. 190130A14a]|uniref:Outer membrane protein beta-barrel domain-containing protein n=1 Tax=Tenacibaculum polynesiense TaxID=3137857 RepID=A0ABM9P8K9_9FLAO
MIVRRIVVIALFLASSMFGQVTGEVFVPNEDRDMFYVHYTPEIEDNSLYEYERISGKFGFRPIKIGKINFYNTIGMDYHSIFNKNNNLSFLRGKEKYYNINYSLLTQYRVSRSWTINALFLPHVIGNFNDELTEEDVNINGILFAEKIFKSKRNKNYYVLSFGVGYLTLSGKTLVNPVVNFTGNINNKVTFTVGLPNTYIKYNFNKKHSIKLLGDLNDFTMRVNKPFIQNQLNSVRVHKSIFTTVTAGIEYTYWLSKNVGIMGRGTHSVYEKYSFEDVNENVLYEYDTNLRSYVTLGLKIKAFNK